MNKTPLPALSEEKFLKAWFLAPIYSMLPWIILPLPLLLGINFFLAVFVVLYFGVILFGIPISMLYEHRGKRSELIFVCLGAVFGQITPFVMALVIGFFEVTEESFLQEIQNAIVPGAVFGAAHGALCAYFYHRIAYRI